MGSRGAQPGPQPAPDASAPYSEGCCRSGRGARPPQPRINCGGRGSRWGGGSAPGAARPAVATRIPHGGDIDSPGSRAARSLRDVCHRRARACGVAAGPSPPRAGAGPGPSRPPRTLTFKLRIQEISTWGGAPSEAAGPGGGRRRRAERRAPDGGPEAPRGARGTEHPAASGSMATLPSAGARVGARSRVVASASSGAARVPVTWGAAPRVGTPHARWRHPRGENSANTSGGTEPTRASSPNLVARICPEFPVSSEAETFRHVAGSSAPRRSF